MPESQPEMSSVTASPTTGGVTVDRPNGSTVYRGWIALFLAAFLLYAATASRGTQWQDSGYHILRIVTGESFNPLGLTLSHPLHHWLGRLVMIPGILEPCFANLAE